MHAHDRVPKSGPVHASGKDRGHLRRRIGAYESKSGNRAKKAGKVGIQFEEGPVPYGDGVVNEIGMEEPRIENRHPRLGRRNITSVDEYASLAWHGLVLSPPVAIELACG